MQENKIFSFRLKAPFSFFKEKTSMEYNSSYLSITPPVVRGVIGSILGISGFKYFSEKKIKIDKAGLRHVLMEYGWAAEWYIRYIYKMKIMQAILDAGIHVKIYGDKWDELEKKAMII